MSVITKSPRDRLAKNTFASVSHSRRSFLKSAATASIAACGLEKMCRADDGDQVKRTKFQIACMTLPYAKFSFERALTGISTAGFQCVALGTTHIESGREKTPIVPIDAPAQVAKERADLCRDHGLTPLMMFSTVYPEKTGAFEKLAHRLKQASAAGIPQVLTFGHTEGGHRKTWIERFRKLAPIARDHNVTLVVKQHGGSTGTGEACAEIIREVNDPSIRVNYDAGNVMDYLNLDPIPDIQKCADVVRSFCIKDHRNWPVDQDCGPGLGEIDHYRLLSPVARLGISMPLCCENIFAPLVPRPETPAGVDKLARRALNHMQIVVDGLART